jgi:hypothetical protein
MPGETPERPQSYQLWEFRERLVNNHKYGITKAIVPLFHDQIEKAVHPSYRTRRVLRQLGRLSDHRTILVHCE